MNEEIKSIFMPNNKYNTLVIERPIMGNFKIGVDEEDICYTKSWDTNESENFKWVTSDNGSEIHCVCVNENNEQESLELKAVFEYDSEISFQSIEIEKDISWKLNVYDSNGKKRMEKIEKENNISIKKGETVIFSLNIEECEEDKTVFIIKDLKCVTLQNKTLRIPVKSMLSVISTTIKSEINNALLAKK